MTMLTYECPHCGYLQEYPNAQAIVVCQACGTRSRMPDERVRERADFRNAREMQHHGDFPNAEASYLRVLDAVPDDADALWGRLLCHYGAKLVIDAGGERRYTINQPRSKPLRAQGDFERACALTLPEIREQYEQDAAYIDAAMQRIRERAAGMPPYDIFICHKTTPLSGQGLTEDYARARDLRDLLTSQGYRVFFAPVDMAGIIAGEGYEAGIYHGLYTAKVMLVVCSTPEHLNATWVRSEWERFLTRCDEGENVALIPLLYGGMKDSQLPRAFTVRNLQAITMELGGKDTLLKRLGELIRRETPAKRDRPMLTVLLALLLIAAFATGGSYVYAQMNGLDWPQGVINAIWDREDTPKNEGSPEIGNDPTATEMITPMPTTSTPAPTTATPAPTTPAPIPTTATPSPTPTATPTASPTPTAPPMPTASPEPTLVTKGKKVGDYRIDVYSNGTCVITDYTGNEAELNVPSLLDGCVVTNLGDNAFNGCSELISITLPEGLASIGYGTFSSCRNLRSITLPDSVTSIGEVAFAGCYELKSITLPKGLTSIGDGMFNECRNLRSITLPDSVTSIGDNAFFLCSELVSIMLPEGLTSIGDYAFQYCKALTSITIPSAVISIGNSAFSGCKALTSITIPSGVTSIGNSAFYGCKALTSITIPSGVTSIGSNAFCECDSLARITLPEGLTSIGPGAFWGCKSLTSITLPDSVISIGDIAFIYIPNLTLYVPRNSYAAAYAQKNNIRYFYTD